MWRVGGYPLWLRCADFSLQWLLLLQRKALRAQASMEPSYGLSSCGSWVSELQCMGLVAPRHAESSGTRDLTCIGKWIHTSTHQGKSSAIFLKTFFLISSIKKQA